MNQKCVLSVDVEDWFHILDLPSTPPMSAWDTLPSTVEKNFRKLLELLERHEARSTCFFLGWVAEKYPHLVCEASRQGHEIASHGYSHTLVYQMNPEDFFQDIRRSRQILEDITGKAVLGYRAPGFSVTKKTPWFFEKVSEAGYRYDSSLFPGTRGHGGIPGAFSAPHEIATDHGTLVEFPMSVVKVLSQDVCLFGGGYLRLFPSWLIETAAGRLMKRDKPVIFYVHPREIDRHHPRLPMSRMRAFKSYVNLKTTKPKLERILGRFRPISFQDYLAQHRAGFEFLSAPNTEVRYARAGK